MNKLFRIYRIFSGSPGAPTKPVLNIDKESVELSWGVTYEGSSPIYGYRIQAKNEGEKEINIG